MTSADDSDYYIDVDNRLGAVTGHPAPHRPRPHGDRDDHRPADMPASVDREQGWRDALRAAGLSDHRVARGDFTEAGGIRAALVLID